MKPYYQDAKATIYCGDCIEVMAEMPENSVDAIVTDPPYGLEFMGAEWDKFGISEGRAKTLTRADKPRDDGFILQGRGRYSILTQQELSMFQSWTTQWATQALRVLKPGGYLLAFGGTRTSHRLVCGLEDAGFEIRDTVCWLHGQGFPKNLDISKQIDKMAGAQMEIIGQKRHCWKGMGNEIYGKDNRSEDEDGYVSSVVTAPATEAAKEWQGWGTALKPAWEIVVAAQKPLTLEGEQNIITVSLKRLEARLWSLLSVNVVVESFELNPSEYDAVCAFAQWSVVDKSNIQEDLLAQMDMSQFVSVIDTSLSIVQSWQSILVDLLKHGNTPTTGTEINQTIDLRTLNSLLLQATPASLIQAVTSVAGVKLNALPVGAYLIAAMEKLNSTLILSALESATSKDEGLNLRPNFEPICVARKPISEKNVASNVLKWGTGGINIDECRIEGDWQKESHKEPIRQQSPDSYSGRFHEDGEEHIIISHPQGRWPANVLLECTCEEVVEGKVIKLGYRKNPTKQRKAFFGKESKDRGERGHIDKTIIHTDPNCPCYMLDEQSGERKATKGYSKGGFYADSDIFSNDPRYETESYHYGDAGGASRFMKQIRAEDVSTRFRYCAKASKAERGEGNTHPTCKPIALIEYLITLVSKPGAVVLDPFAGSMTTVFAAVGLGRQCFAIDQSLEYCQMLKGRCRQIVMELGV